MFRILLIDDDPLMLKLATAVLNHDPSFSVTSHSSGAEGVASATETKPDLVLCDVFMSGMSGQDVFRALRGNPATKDIPFIFTTARAHRSKVAALMEMGADAVIAKPFKLRELSKIVHEHLKLADTAGEDIPLAPVEYDFAERLRSDAETLKACRQKLAENIAPAELSEEFQTCVHKLAGAAAIYEFPAVSEAASALEDVIVDARAGRKEPSEVPKALDTLLACMAEQL